MNIYQRKLKIYNKLLSNKINKLQNKIYIKIKIIINYNYYKSNLINKNQNVKNNQKIKNC